MNRHVTARFRWNSDRSVGIAVMLAGAVIWWLGRDLPRGTAVRMGPGYVPMVLAGLLAALGALLAVTSRRAPPAETWAPASIIVVMGAILGFCLTATSLGILPALTLAGVISQLPMLRAAPLRTVLLSLAIAATLTAIFVLGLGLPVKALPWS